MRSVDKSDWVFMLIGFLSRVIESRIVRLDGLRRWQSFECATFVWAAEKDARWPFQLWLLCCGCAVAVATLGLRLTVARLWFCRSAAAVRLRLCGVRLCSYILAVWLRRGGRGSAVAARAVGLDRRAAGTLRLRLWLCGSRAVWVYMSVYGCCVVVAAVGLRLALRLRFCSCGCDCAAVSPRRSAVHSYIMAVWLWRGGCGCAVVAAAVGLWRLAAALALQLRLRAVWLLGCMAVVGFGCVVARQAFMPFGFLHVKSHVDIGF